MISSVSGLENIIYKGSVFDDDEVEDIIDRMKRLREKTSENHDQSKDGENVRKILSNAMPKIDELVQSKSVRPVEFYDGWCRTYGKNFRHKHLGAHTDFFNDELSVVIQFSPGAFFFVYPIGFEGDPDPNDLPLVHLNAGDIVIFQGRECKHGCRQLKDSEIRHTIAMFYEIPNSRKVES